VADKSLRVSELERFARNLENFAKTNPDEAMYHYFYGIWGLGSNGTESALKPSACPQTLVASG
jgi:hypothetical protein